MVDMGGHEEVEDVALLGGEGGHGAEDALDEAAAVGAVGAEAAVAPEDGSAEAAFCQVVGRRQVGLVGEEPHGGFPTQELAASTVGLCRRPAGVARQLHQPLDLSALRLNPRQHHGAVDLPVSSGSPSCQDPLTCQNQPPSMPLAAVALSYGLEVPQHVRPVQAPPFQLLDPPLQADQRTPQLRVLIGHAHAVPYPRRAAQASAVLYPT